MSIEYRFLEPLDVLFLRGNKLFGDPGSFGESLVPPWPSVAAGALRSRMLADDGMDFAAFARGELTHPSLGTPEQPGPFTVTAFHLARRYTDGRVEILSPPPADLVIGETDGGSLAVKTLTPTPLPKGEGQKVKGHIACSYSLPSLPVLAEDMRSKPAGGYWLSEAGWKRYLAGEVPETDELVQTSELWKIDPRVGVGLDTETRRAADGRLFSVQAVAMKKREHAPQDGFDVGFLVGIANAEPPKTGTLRLGGDGRAAAIHAVETALPEPDFAAIVAAKRCRLVLTAPGIFSIPLPEGEGPGVRAGWLPTGTMQTADGQFRFELHGVRGRLVCAVVPRAEVVSGWDLAKWQPKAAQRAAPAGSVYWLDELEATPESLRKLAERGLWPEPEDNSQRRAEGFNRLAIARWRDA